MSEIQSEDPLSPLEVGRESSTWKVGKSQKEVIKVPEGLIEPLRGLSPNMRISGAHTISVIPSVDLRPMLKEAKKEERVSVLGAYKEARKDSLDELRSVYEGAGRQLNSVPAGSIPSDVSPVDTFSDARIAIASVNAAARVIIREAKLNGLDITAEEGLVEARKLLSQEKVENINQIDAPPRCQRPGVVLLTKDQALKLYEAAKHNEKLAGKKLSRDYKDLCTILVAIDAEISRDRKETDSEELSERNKKILMLFRKAVQSEAYIFLCKDESVPAVAYLHRLVMASFIRPTPLAVYREISEQALKSDLATNNFHDTLANLYTTGRARNFTEDDKVVSYVLENKGIAFSALQSEMPRLGPVLGHALGEYDPRMGENASGTLFTESLTTAKGNKELSFIYSPTPTLGNDVSPEAEAFLRALENRQFMSPDQLAKEPSYGQHTHWTFTSLQNLEAKNEGKRAKAIMELNRRFPLSFTGITVTQDSEFYKDGVHGSNKKKIEQAKIERAKSALNDDYKEAMKKELIAEEGGYFFPSGGVKGVYGSIVEAAYEIVKESTTIDKDKLWQWRQKAAFRELVNLGIMRYWQLQFLPKQGKGIATSCCKECIDRGGKTMAELMWALGDGKQKSLEQTFSAVLGRALLARNRMILRARLEPFLCLTEFVSQDKAHEFLTETIGRWVTPRLLRATAQPALP